MAHIFADNVREGSTTEGTGNFILEGGIPAPGGIIIGRTFSSVVTNGDTFDYSIFHQSLNEWEIGVGTYLGSNTFSRSPTSSSTAANLGPFSPGTKQVFIAPVAARMFDTVPDSRLPTSQSGKNFNSTTTVSGESGFRIDYGSQEFSIGGSEFDVPDFTNVIRNVDPGVVTWYIDTDKVPTGFRIRMHDSGSNFRNAFVALADGTGLISGGKIKTLSESTNSEENSFPLGHTLLVNSGGAAAVPRNSGSIVRLHSGSLSSYVLDGGTNQGAPLFGTWLCRGRSTDTSVHLMERVV